MNTIEELEKTLQQRLSEQSWVGDYEVTTPELRLLVLRLRNYVIGVNPEEWDDPEAPAIPKAVDLKRIASLVKEVQAIQKHIDQTKHVLDHIERTSSTELREEERIPLSSRLRPLLADLVEAGRIALHPSRRTRRGAPKKALQDNLIKSTGVQMRAILARHSVVGRGPSVAEVAREVANVISVIGIKVKAKRIQVLLKGLI